MHGMRCLLGFRQVAMKIDNDYALRHIAAELARRGWPPLGEGSGGIVTP